MAASRRGGAGPPSVRPSSRGGHGTDSRRVRSRSPRRPNSIGLSLVRQLAIVEHTISFAGVDLIDGTPVLDIKPWFADCHLANRCRGAWLRKAGHAGRRGV
ncbi:MAG TPA: TrmO family methyltransferase [Actinomycetota bacterium]|nr:TrmO family methyltransferase [Actinomycetota bacterium]